MATERVPKDTSKFSGVVLVKAESAILPTEQEAEARLHQEGYSSFRWYDVAGSFYPRHRHDYDECLWVLSGEIIFVIAEAEYRLGPGDRLYLPRATAHTAKVPAMKSVTYLVGRKKS